MLKLLFATLLTVSASVSFAGTRENFNACAAQDPSWMSNWGNYIVAFELNDAQNICRSSAVPSTARRAGCYLSGSWATAGYYCEEVSPGG